MDTQAIPLRATAARFLQSVKLFGASEFGPKAKFIFLALVALLCAATGLNALNSYVGRNFMTAIANRNSSEFARQALIYVGVFMASTIVSVIARFAEERLGLLWREAITRGAIGLYLLHGTYYRLESTGELGNPDQRIAEDVKTFTISTISFVLLWLNGTFTIIAFSGILWAINPLLFGVAVLYAALGSCATLILGRPLVRLNYDQFDREAGFRSGLTEVRQNAEAILLAQAEDRHAKRLLKQFEGLVANYRHVIAINRNVNFFSTGYNWLIQIIPALIIAPSFIKGDIQFGVITQSAMAFSTLVAAFSLIVTQYQALSTYAAVLARLSAFLEASEKSSTAAGRQIEIIEHKDLIFEHLSLLSSTNGGALLKDLSVTILVGCPTLITGPNRAAVLALFRATAGAAVRGSGRILRPVDKRVQFLAQRPYLPPCTLREVLVNEDKKTLPTDNEIVALLQDLDLAHVVGEAGGLDREQDWGVLLPLSDQHLIAAGSALLARPSFVVLDRPGASLSAERLRRILILFSARGITCVCCGEADGASSLFEGVLECREDGGWSWSAKQEQPPPRLS